MEVYKFDCGHISVSYSSEDLSIGTLTLYPNSRLDMHSRPVEEQLLQVHASGGLVINSDEDNQKIIIDEGETYNIPANKRHSHFNPTDNTSTVLWRFDGDITGIISNIRSDTEKL